VIKYIGSKRLLVPLITEITRGLQKKGSVVDLFSGTARVGHALKATGYQVFSNDLNSYAALLARCYVQANREQVAEQAQKLINEMNLLPPEPGYFTKTFCEEARYFMPKNGARVDSIRNWIAHRHFEPELEAVLLTSLMEAADRVDSTTGVQMAYLKKWAPRASKDLELRLPALLAKAKSGNGLSHQFEAQEAARRISGDIGYLDPPYNQHKYVGNYHIWETLVRWDAPECYGIARKRIDCRERKSAFNSRPRIHSAMAGIIENLDVRHLVVSFSNEGFIKQEEMIALLARRGEVFVIERDFKRYVGAKIGIHNPSGKCVGKVSHLSNKEYLFVVPEHPDLLAQWSGPLRVAGTSTTVPNRTITPSLDKQPARRPTLALRNPLIKVLQAKGALSSQTARAYVGGTPTELRTLFRALLSEGLIHKTGQRRGTKYHWIEGKTDAPTGVGGKRKQIPFPPQTSLAKAIDAAHRKSQLSLEF